VKIKIVEGGRGRGQPAARWAGKEAQWRSQDGRGGWGELGRIRPFSRTRSVCGSARGPVLAERRTKCSAPTGSRSRSPGGFSRSAPWFRSDCSRARHWGLYFPDFGGTSTGAPCSFPMTQGGQSTASGSKRLSLGGRLSPLGRWVEKEPLRDPKGRHHQRGDGTSAGGPPFRGAASAKTSEHMRPNHTRLDQRGGRLHDSLGP